MVLRISALVVLLLALAIPASALELTLSPTLGLCLGHLVLDGFIAEPGAIVTGYELGCSGYRHPIAGQAAIGGDGLLVITLRIVRARYTPTFIPLALVPSNPYTADVQLVLDPDTLRGQWTSEGSFGYVEPR